MIVLQAHVHHVFIFEPKRDPPVSSYPNRPIAFALTPQRVKPESGELTQIGQGSCIVKSREASFDPRHHLRWDALLFPLFKEAFQSPMPE